MKKTVDYFYSHLSPYAYLGHQTLLELATKHQLDIQFRPINLLQVFEKTGGLPLGKRHKVRIAYRTIELLRWREKRGIALNIAPKFFPTNPQPSELAAISISKQGGDIAKFSALVFQAIWQEDKDIADPQVITQLIENVGSKPDNEANDQTQVMNDYIKNTEIAIELGVIGSPSYVYQGEIFWGQDRLELLDDALSSGRAPLLMGL
ncbi:2-hydroxychromene-2-carboxylate isomerase [Agarilytica rhodophyticola]|uniref:2-hydroxychromene-2-carboxylate isomerase n=1 Tax=Agarilytica rhodophyticola TaxID=1737490 RepID=UPI000B3457C1|nr:2-hydroxychromene-2-carboxylate isomerase [Agarilytica rhodophyticola]